MWTWWMQWVGTQWRRSTRAEPKAQKWCRQQFRILHEQGESRRRWKAAREGHDKLLILWLKRSHREQVLEEARRFGLSRGDADRRHKSQFVEGSWLVGTGPSLVMKHKTNHMGVHTSKPKEVCYVDSGPYRMVLLA